MEFPNEKSTIEEIERPETPELPQETKPIEPIPEIPMAEISEFIFRLPNGNEVGRANNLDDFLELIRRGPLDSILYHANEEHFSPWLEFKGHKKLAKKIKNIKGTNKRVRKRLLKIISRNR